MPVPDVLFIALLLFFAVAYIWCYKQKKLGIKIKIFVIYNLKYQNFVKIRTF